MPAAARPFGAAPPARTQVTALAPTRRPWLGSFSVLWISLVLVLLGAAWMGINLSAGPELALGYEQMIHARVPWLVLGILWLGGALGVASLFRKRRWFHYPVLGVEVLVVSALSLYFLQLSYLPAHELKVAVGEPFPSYSLFDQDATLRGHDAGSPGDPALYIFYRGDW